MSDQEKLPEIDPNSVENFPLDNPKAKIVRDRGRIRVVERDYYWDKEKKRGLEKRRYLGMIVDGRFYDTELYAKLFKRSGARRLVPKQSEESLTIMTPRSRATAFTCRHGSSLTIRK